MLSKVQLQPISKFGGIHLLLPAALINVALVSLPTGVVAGQIHFGPRWMKLQNPTKPRENTHALRFADGKPASMDSVRVFFSMVFASICR